SISCRRPGALCCIATYSIETYSESSGGRCPRLDGDGHRPRAEQRDEPHHAGRGAVDDGDVDVVASLGVELVRLPDERVVGAEEMSSRGDGAGGALAVHQRRDLLAVERHDHLTLLRILG